MKDVQLRGLWTLAILVIFSFALVGVRTSFHDETGSFQRRCHFLGGQEIATLQNVGSYTEK